VRVQPVINCLSASLAAAVTDESLQLLSARGSQTKDVLLVFCGAVTGMSFILLIYGIIILFKKHKRIAPCK
jgi:VanZ family protein